MRHLALIEPMTPFALRYNWETFGRADSLWAIYTDSNKFSSRWNLDALLATGGAEAAVFVAEVGGPNSRMRRRRALDFGCGLGRLMQPLARHIDRVDGVDIAASMPE